MKHADLWIMAVILILLVLIVGGSYAYIMRSAEQVAENFPDLAAAIASEDWPEARRLFRESKLAWEQVRRVWPLMINEDEMRDVEISFVDMEVLLEQENTERAARELANLRFYLRSIPEGERVSWQNLL